MTALNTTQHKTKEKVDSLLSFTKSLKTNQEIEKFAKACGTTSGNLQQIAYGGSVSARLSKQINKASKGKVLLAELRPDVFA